MARKINLKGSAKNMGREATKAGLIMVGMIASKKVTQMATAKLDPNGFFMKYEGWIKAGGGLFLLASGMIKNEMLKSIILGMVIEGGITAIRKIPKVGDQIPAIGQAAASGNWPNDMNVISNQVATHPSHSMRGVDDVLIPGSEVAGYPSASAFTA